MLSSIPSAYELSPLPQSLDPDGIKLIIGGYSYGSLITTLLPPIDDIIKRFAEVNKGTAEAEIRLRAIRLAAQWNKDAVLYHEAQRARKTRSHEKLRALEGAMAVAVGGEESEPGSRHASREGRGSLDAVRRSVERSRRKLLRRGSSEVSNSTLIVESLVHTKIPSPQTHYLLISPLQPPISVLATMFSYLRSGYLAQKEAKFLDHPTLVLYGDKDFLASQKRLRKWAESLISEPGSLFQFHEIAGAGHLWQERGVENQMRGFIREWTQGIARSC